MSSSNDRICFRLAAHYFVNYDGLDLSISILFLFLFYH